MNVTNTAIIDAPTDDIWKTIRAYENVESYNPMVTSSKITGTEEGSERTCQVQLGDQKAEIFEKLDSVDEQNKTIKISVTNAPPPFAGQQITFKVKPLDETKTELQISTEVGEDKQAAKGISDVFQMMSEGLKKLHEKAVN